MRIILNVTEFVDLAILSKHARSDNPLSNNSTLNSSDTFSQDKGEQF